MNHLIDSYGLFFIFFFSMFILVGVVDYLARQFKPGLWGTYNENDGKTIEQLEKRVAELEAEVKNQR